MEHAEKILDISWRTILKIAIAITIFYFLFSIREIIVWFIFALTISVLFNPAVDFLHKKRMPRGLAVVLIYVVTFGILGLLIYMMVPIFISEIRGFIEFFPQYFEKISPSLRGLGFEAFSNIETFLKSVEKNLQAIAGSIFSAVFAIFGGIFTTLFIFITAIFLSLEEHAVEKTLTLLFPKKYEAQALNIWQRCQKKVAAWFGGRLLACLFVGVASYIAFIIFAVDRKSVV